MPHFGITVFPNTPYDQPTEISISQAELEAEQASKEFPGSKFPPHTVLSMSVVVCIAYQPGFKKTNYHTFYALDLVKIGPTNTPQMIFTIGEQVDASHWFLRLHPSNAIRAD